MTRFLTQRTPAPITGTGLDQAIFVLLHPAATLVHGIGRTLGAWAHRSAGRRDLAALDPRMLRDIGLDADVAAQECAKPFWRA